MQITMCLIDEGVGIRRGALHTLRNKFDANAVGGHPRQTEYIIVIEIKSKID